MITLLAQIDFGALGQQLGVAGLKEPFLTGSANNVSEIVNILLPYLFVFAGLLLLSYLIAGGFQLMTSANNEKGVAAAKAKITNAVIGFLLLFVSFWLVQIIEVILGVQLL